MLYYRIFIKYRVKKSLSIVSSLINFRWTKLYLSNIIFFNAYRISIYLF